MSSEDPIRELRIPDLIWEAAKIRSTEDGIDIEDALDVLVRAYAYGRIGVGKSDAGTPYISAVITLPGASATSR